MADDMFMSCEENFAPILGVYVFETEKEVVKRANDTSMGLASYVFTKDVDRLWRLFENLEAGMIGLVSYFHPVNLFFLFLPFLNRHRTLAAALLLKRLSEGLKTADSERRAARTLPSTSL
jgi:hypothetical protein